MPKECQHGFGPSTLVYTRCGDHDGQDASARVDEEMPLAAFDLFVDSNAAEPPVSVVFPDWLSIIPALGWRRFPVATRTSPRSKSCLRGQVLSWRQRQQYW